MCNIYGHKVQQRCTSHLGGHLGVETPNDPAIPSVLTYVARLVDFRKRSVQIYKCEQRKAELQTEASAEHTSPFCNEKETRHLRIRVHLDVENVCNSS